MKPKVTLERENMLRLALSIPIELQAAKCTWPRIGSIKLDRWSVCHGDGSACRHPVSLALHTGFLKQAIQH